LICILFNLDSIYTRILANLFSALVNLYKAMDCDWIDLANEKSTP